jgi:hypothetical protein
VSTTKTTDPDPQRILDLPLAPDNDSGAATVRGYLIELLAALWREGADFSGKRPFGNSGWRYDLLVPLVRAGLISGSFDADGYLDDCDDVTGEQFILAAIKSLGEPAP